MARKQEKALAAGPVTKTLRGWLRLIDLQGEYHETLCLVRDRHMDPLRVRHEDVYEVLADEVADHIRNHGNWVTVRWATAPEAFTSLDAALLATIERLEGVGEAKYGAYYTETTGYLWTDEDLVVGGHDVMARLKERAGEYLVLEVAASRTAREVPA